MKKKIFTALLVGSMILSVTACGSTDSNNSTVSAKNEVSQEETEKVKEPVDLTGTWKSEDNDGSWMEATINDNTISIDWVSDNGDTKSIYWVGSYTAPTEYSDEYTWTSTNDKEQTASALLASPDDTKDFTYSDSDKELSYQVSMMGTTTTMRMTKSE